MSAVMVRDDIRAKQIAADRGIVVPPIYEVAADNTGCAVRQMFMGWVVRDGETERGFVIIFSSIDGEDWEIMADGGWSVKEARRLFRMIFNEANQPRVSARCKSDNMRNISALLRMGFQVEGRKRLPDGEIVMLGMMRDECKLLKEAA